ncbi:hypothetical protein AVM11_12035 [Sphingomonas melonis TY]|uniref:Uncharacterized protein n=2 Tax=Sphingomonas melonis TaxID=152682 RepID=A0A175XZC4_9SPHN|nr:hypothetical protein BJP26_14680 [Sphingomonas melonis TY]KZB93589.1 hypothetical protein AVM11_12035 [Sphingomonas melonis TY]
MCDGQTSFVRAAARRHEWPMWANVQRIEPKRTRWRVLLLGESVARGQLYEPRYTPALVLQALLEAVLGAGTVDVVDLARTGMGPEVSDLAIAAAVLEPDAVVMFAGNNWRPYDPTEPHRLPKTNAVLREGGVSGLKNVVEGEMRCRATEIVRAVRDFYTARAIPVLWIVPEFNLGDWHDWPIVAPTLTGGHNAAWLSSCATADQALADGDLALAEVAAARLLALDGGISGRGQQILARCRRLSGDLPAARAFLEAARDARLWDWSQPLPPRCAAATRQAILAEGGQGTSQVLDVPVLLGEFLDGGLPDRRVFLDFCHLNSDGIRLVMAAAAASLADTLVTQRVRWQEIIALAPSPEPALAAEAELLAAVHNAHWWQPTDIVRYHCDRALALWPAIAEVMVAFTELQTTPTPAMLSAAAARLSAHGGAVAQYLLGYSVQQLDAVLLDAMSQSLADAGSRWRTDPVEAWLRHRDAARVPADLLDFYLLSAADQPQETFGAMPLGRGASDLADPTFYRAYRPVSIFRFVAGASKPIVIDLTFRVPTAAAFSQRVRVLVNNRPVADLPACPAWTRHRIEIAADTLQRGLNTVRLEWPQNALDEEARLGIALEQRTLELPELFRVFADVSAFTAAAPIADLPAGSDSANVPCERVEGIGGC